MTDYETRMKNLSATKAKWKKAGLEWWKSTDPKVRAYYQLQEEILILDFDDFHRSVETLMGRPVWTHEFAYPDELLEELKSGKKATLDDVLEKAAEFGKPVIVINKDEPSTKADSGGASR